MTADIHDTSIRQAVILAGGYGTRLKPFTDANPKPMYSIEGKPFLEYLVEQVKGFGISEIVLLLGYLPEKVIEYFGDGRSWGIAIRYSITPVEHETGLRLKGATDLLDDNFLLMYCDNYCPIDFAKLQYDFHQNNATIQMTAYTNRDAYTKDNLKYDAKGLVIIYDKKRETAGLSGVDIGYAIVRKEALTYMPEGNLNFESTVYPQLVVGDSLFVTPCEHRYYSCGSWERMALSEQFFRRRSCILLDRDGTLNVRPPRACYIEKPEDYEWLEGAREAVKLLNDNGYLVVVISNQPGIARGNLDEARLAEIQKKMQDELAAIDAHIDAFYYCPHNWDEGCFCRKPKPGLLYQAQRELSIDLTRATLIGDDGRDIEAGEAARCTCFYVNEHYRLINAVNTILDAGAKKETRNTR